MHEFFVFSSTPKIVNDYFYPEFNEQESKEKPVIEETKSQKEKPKKRQRAYENHDSSSESQDEDREQGSSSIARNKRLERIKAKRQEAVKMIEGAPVVPFQEVMLTRSIHLCTNNRIENLKRYLADNISQ